MPMTLAHGSPVTSSHDTNRDHPPRKIAYRHTHWGFSHDPDYRSHRRRRPGNRPPPGRGGAKVAAVTRDPHAEFPAGTQLVHPTKVPTLGGVEAILLSPRAAGSTAVDLLARARETGAARAVVLSAVTVQYPAGHARFRQQFHAAEKVVQGSGLDWTILRCADFAANTLAWAGQIQVTGTVRGRTRTRGPRLSTSGTSPRWPPLP